jgi:AcrR family transcriptional regulator
MVTRAQIVPLIGEVFREHGFEGASLAAIGAATGLGKGSLYHFFPGGKEEMANAVLDEIGNWFEREIFTPLASNDPAAIEAMFVSVASYFHSGRRVCLVGAFALNDCRERFGKRLADYFQRWIDALATALTLRGFGRKKARRRSEETVAGIQGAIVLARALNDSGVFDAAMTRLARRLAAPSPERGA